MASAVSSPPPVARSASSNHSSSNVSYEMFAPRSAAQVSRLSRIAALTAGPIATSGSSSDYVLDDVSDGTLLKAMSPQLWSSSSRATVGHRTIATNDTDDAEVVPQTVAKAVETTDHLTHLLKHSASLRLALRASINIAEDISNRHAELIRHSSALSAAADRLQEEQAILTAHAEEIGMPLKHYDAVDDIGVLVGVLFKGKAVVRGLAKIKVDNDDFPLVLDQIDDAVDFFGRESGGKEALEAELKRQKSAGTSSKESQISGKIEYYRRSLALQEAALFLVREAVVDRVAATTTQIASALNIPKTPIPADKLESSLIYTRFHGISYRSNRLLSLIRQRLHHGEAYYELLQLCRNTYCTSRESLLKATIRTHMDKLRDQHGLVGMTRLASVFLIRLCTVETALYLDFFGDKKEDPSSSEEKITTEPKRSGTLASQVVSEDGTYYDSEFQSYLSTLCSALHRTVRRGLVTVLDLDTLCQIVSVLREERTLASSSPTTTAAARAIASVIEDAQERLIFCATNTLHKEVGRFKATPADLDYPDKLRKKEKDPNAESSPDGASPDDVYDAFQLQLEVYESWFPPMRSVLRILSKIFRVVEPRVFEDIALQSVQSCTGCLRDGSHYIQKRKGDMHAHLFLVKHLLVSRFRLGVGYCIRVVNTHF
jgi:conserved oligomeric Golgi complex subunit 3